MTEQHEQIARQRFVLTSKRDDIKLTVNGVLGEAKLQEAVYNPILDHLADHKIRSFGELLGELDAAHTGVTFAQLFQALLLLIGAGHVVPVQDEDVVSACRERCMTCNAVLRDLARSNNDIAYNVSCISGGGVMVDRFQQLFLLAHASGESGAENLARYVWEILKGNGQLITKEGKVLKSDKDNIQELTARAKKFAERLKVLEMLEMA